MSLRRLAVVGVLDQFVSSGTNFLATFLIIRLGSTESFGYIALVMSLYLLMLTISRAFTVEPTLIRGSEFRTQIRTNLPAWTSLSIGGALLLAIPPLVLCRGLLDARFTIPAIALLGASPLLLWQDTRRYQALASEQPYTALRIDVAWLVLFGTSVASCAAFLRITPLEVFLCWVISGAGAGLSTELATKPPATSAQVKWVKSYLHISAPTFLDVGVAAGAAFISSIVLVYLTGSSTNGAIRASQTVFAPVSILYIGTYPALVRLFTLPTKGSRRAMSASWVMVALNLAVGGFALAVPLSVGALVFGGSWAEIRTVLLPVTIWTTIASLPTGPLVALRALGRARTVLMWRFITTPISLVLSAAGALRWGVFGYCLGSAAPSLPLLFGLLHALSRGQGTPESSHNENQCDRAIGRELLPGKPLLPRNVDGP